MSVFDVLMANASIKSSSSSSPRKRKPPIDSQTPNSVCPTEKHQRQKDESATNQFGDEKSSNVGSVAAKKAKCSICPADESVAELKKKTVEFNVKRAVYWGQGERVPFMFVAKAFDAISKVSGRIAITEIVCNMLRTVMKTTPADLLAVVYLLANRIAPAHEGLELGIGDALTIKALAEAYGTT